MTRGTPMPEPAMPMHEALEIAVRTRGRPVADVRSVQYVSATQIGAALAEDPSRRAFLKRTDPHWRIQFAGREWIADHDGVPCYRCTMSPSDDLVVFADGSVLTKAEANGNPPPTRSP